MLQIKDLCAAEAQQISKKIVETLKKMKDVQSKAANPRFHRPKLPRKMIAPHRIEKCLGGNAASKFHKDIVFYYRKTYYGDLDCITNAITDYLDQIVKPPNQGSERR